VPSMSVTGYWGARNCAFSAPKTWVNSSVKRSSGTVLVAPRSLLSCIVVAPEHGEEDHTCPDRPLPARQRDRPAQVLDSAPPRRLPSTPLTSLPRDAFPLSPSPAPQEGPRSEGPG